MKTISFRISYEDSNHSIKNDERIYSSVVRYSLERFYENKDQTSIRRDCVSKFNFTSYLITCAVKEAYSIYKKFKDQEKKVVFGDFKRYLKGLISKDDYKKSKNRGVYSEGDYMHYGNQLFQIDIENYSVVYKRKRNEHIVLNLCEKLSDKRKRILELLYLTMRNKQSPVSFRIKNDNLYITYDETVIESFKKFKELKSNRILGIDLNPNYIGLSVLEFDDKDEFKIIHKRVYDLSELNDNASTNKVRYEIKQIDNEMLKLCKHFKVSKLAIEDLKFKKNNKFWSKKLNKLCKNKFRYSSIKQHLNTLCNVHGVEFIEVNSAYSSFVGNFCYGSDSTPDMIAASIEITRRGYKKFQKEWFYPPMVTLERIKEVLRNQWKKELKLDFKFWKKLFEKIKEFKLSYRFQLVEVAAVFRQNYYKKKTKTYVFA